MAAPVLWPLFHNVTKRRSPTCGAVGHDTRIDAGAYGAPLDHCETDAGVPPPGGGVGGGGVGGGGVGGGAPDAVNNTSDANPVTEMDEVVVSDTDPVDEKA